MYVLRRIIRVLWCVYPTQCIRIIRPHWKLPVSLLHLSNLSQRSFGHSKYILSMLFHCDLISLWWIGHLVSTMHWTSHLDSALDVSDIAWTLSKGTKESYKYDLANSLVPLIALSLDHQNHLKWPKWVMFVTVSTLNSIAVSPCMNTAQTFLLVQDS